MPTVYHQTSPPSVMTSSFNFTSKLNQNAPQIDGLMQMRELNLVRHIEALKAAANAPLLFPNLNNSSKPNPPFLSIAKSGEHTDISALKNRPHSSNWAIDPSLVPGNLRKQADNNGDTNLTLEDLLSRGSSVSEKAEENSDGPPVVKSRVKARRKSNKSLKLKADTNSESSVARSSSFNAFSRLSRGSQNNSKSFDKQDLDALTALCKGITIQEKSSSHINVRLAPYSNGRKQSVATTHAPQQSVTKSTAQTTVCKVGPVADSKKILVASDHSQVKRKKSVTKAEDVKTVKIFQSDQQSGVISDLGMAVPCAPPATPTAEQLRKYEYIPSLQDIRAQRSFRQRLQMMETKAAQREMRKQESQAVADRLSLKEKKLQLKKFQRQQIYALNKVMTDLENERFVTFMQSIGSG